MLLFPNAKINLGLRVIEKRGDGYHSIETIFIPVSLCDCLEFIEFRIPASTLEFSGIPIKGKTEDNMVLKAWQIMHRNHDIPNVRFHLHKIIPTGAGLGGGSADAAFVLKGLNAFFSCGCTPSILEKYASEIGSDCAFFIRNCPALGTGRGEILENVFIPFQHYEVLLVYPGIHVNTREAYAGIIPRKPEIPLNELLTLQVDAWQEAIRNEFEEPVFAKYPLLAELKNKILKAGAVYASMSGSGSTVYGIFREGELNGHQLQFKSFFSFAGKFLLQQNESELI
jgi:4-diphosphocytidyl-2-C-methyl-D-erythritol kinase